VLKTKSDRIIFLSLVGIFFSASAIADSSLTVFTNGKFYTANQQAPWANAVVVEDDKIAFVGNDSGALEFAGSGAKIVDLKNKLVLPGLVDAHTHPGMVAVSHDLLEMEIVHDKERLMQNIANMIAANPDRAVIMGGYWDNGTFGETGPHRADLDRIESERPVILYDYWGHTVWANSRALEVAGVDRDTPDIVPGFSFYQRDESGEPSGWVTESAASVFANNFQSITPAVEEQIIGFLTYLRNLGVTTGYRCATTRPSHYLCLTTTRRRLTS